MAREITKPQFKQMPWKNGLGTTTEIYRLEVKGQLIFRLSTAAMASNGPFSLYPGIDRTISLLDGAGFTLVAPDSTTEIFDPLKVHAFAGESQIECRLKNNKCLDFNTMVDRKYGNVQVAKHVIEANQSYAFTNKKYPTFIYFHPAETLYTLQPNEVFSLDLNEQNQVIEVTLVIN